MNIQVEGPLFGQSAICQPVLRSLPEWFGVEAAVQKYVSEMDALPTYLVRAEDVCLGFLSIKRHNPIAAELYVMGVRQEVHHQGIGRALVARAEADLRAQGVQFLQVKTLGPSNPDPGYGRTRAFYQSLGFHPLEETNAIWDEQNPCLLLIKVLGQPYSLHGKLAVVTGASRRIGIGAEIARELARGGADVFITYYQPYDAAQPWGSQASEVEDLLAELRLMGVRAAGMQLDLSQPEAVGVLFDQVQSQLGHANILVNDACVSENGDWQELTAAQFDRHYAVNLRAVGLLCAEFARRCPAGGGHIVSLTSGQGVGPMGNELAYAATKGGMEALTLSLSPALARRGISINAIDPGITDTGWISPELAVQFLSAAPFGRLGFPRDAAHLVRFLVSDEGGWITGQVLHSRGGL